MLSYDDLKNKPHWMRPPQWRWVVSEEYLANPTKPTDVISSDRSLKELVDYKRYLSRFPDKPDKHWNKYPEASTAYNMYLNSMTDGWRWLLEAYLMTSLSDREIVHRLKVDVNHNVIRRYRRFFFDIEPYRESKAAVTANLLSTSKVKLNATGISDYTWKIFAYVWGADAFEDMFFPGKGNRNKEHIDWLRESNSENLDVYSFHITRDLRQNYNEQAVNILNTARNYWDITEKDTSDLEEQSKREFIDTLSRHVHMKILNSDPKRDDYSEDLSSNENEAFMQADREKIQNKTA